MAGPTPKGLAGGCYTRISQIWAKDPHGQPLAPGMELNRDQLGQVLLLSCRNKDISSPQPCL